MNVVRVSNVSKPYWKAIPEDVRAAIAAAVPEGHVIHIAPGYRAKPGVADVSLRREVHTEWGAPSWTVVKQERGRDLAYLCRAVLS